MKNDTHRIDQYGAKYVASTVSLKVAQRLDTMKSSYATVANSIAAKELEIQTLLNGQTPAIQTADYPFYLAFGRQLWALGFRGINGTAATAQAQQYKIAWTTRGLDSATLIAIALQVFSITVV